jgi:hypothetical protein
MERDELRLMCIKLALELALEYDSDKTDKIRESQLIDRAQEIYKWIVGEREN